MCLCTWWVFAWTGPVAFGKDATTPTSHRSEDAWGGAPLGCARGRLGPRATTPPRHGGWDLRGGGRQGKEGGEANMGRRKAELAGVASAR
jgi:hypothetical protein